MANVVDLLLETDIEKLTEIPEEEYELKRLSKLVGSPFKVTVKALTSAKLEQLEKACKNKKGEVDSGKLNSLVVLYSVYQGDELLFKNKELKEKFKVPTPKELIDKMLLYGEISDISRVVMDLMGFKKDDDRDEDYDIIDEIKN